MLSKFWSRLRPLPVILSIGAFALGVSTAIAITATDLPSIIAGNPIKNVTVEELQQGKLKPVFLIDVRSPEEYADDRISKSPLVPITDIEAGFGVKQILNLVPNIQADGTKPTVVLYCAAGPRSNKAYRLLQKTGLNMVVLSGGITAWRKAVPPERDAATLNALVLPAKK